MALIIRPADNIKAKVIDYLIANYDGIIIGNEVMYGSSRKLVDLLALYQGETYAIEIKSEKDDLRRLPEQLSEYAKIFDHTFIYTTTVHLSSIKKMVKEKASVFVIDEGMEVKGSLLEKKNNTQKSEMLASMNSLFIRRRLNIPNAENSDIVRGRAMRCKKEKIHTLLYDFFLEKLSAPYYLFLAERGERTEIDDITILSNRLTVE